MKNFPDFQCNLVVFGSIQGNWFVRPGFFVFSGSQVRIFVYRPVRGIFCNFSPDFYKFSGPTDYFWRLDPSLRKRTPLSVSTPNV